MTSDASAPLIRPATAADMPAIAALAAEIWRAHYPGIISTAQIEYMLAERYALDVLRAELESADRWWDVLTEHGEPRAFSSLHRGASGDEMKLDKLYVHPGRQRRGYGAMLLRHNVQRARVLGAARLILAVNKRNDKAIAAYRKFGFRIADAVVKDIGAGFVMDDFIMAYDL